MSTSATAYRRDEPLHRLRVEVFLGLRRGGLCRRHPRRDPGLLLVELAEPRDPVALAGRDLPIRFVQLEDLEHAGEREEDDERREENAEVEVQEAQGSSPQVFCTPGGRPLCIEMFP